MRGRKHQALRRVLHSATAFEPSYLRSARETWPAVVIGQLEPRGSDRHCNQVLSDTPQQSSRA
jgi:hypothetical protein